MKTSIRLPDLPNPVEPCGATENVVLYPCMVVALIVWRETLMMESVG